MSNHIILNRRNMFLNCYNSSCHCI